MRCDLRPAASDREILWITRASVLPDRSGLMLRMASAGYDAPASPVALQGAALSSFLALLGEEPVALDVPELLLPRLLGAVLLAAPRGYAVDAVRPRSRRRRPLLVGLASSAYTAGDRPLHSNAGIRLAELLGLRDVSVLLGTLDTLLLPAGKPLVTLRAAERLLVELAGDRRPVVVLGELAAAAITAALGCRPDALLYQRELDVQHVAPDPRRASGWDTTAVRQLRRAVLRALGVPLPNDAAVSAAREGQREGWRILADRGLVAHSQRFAAAWRVDASGALERQFHEHRAHVAGGVLRIHGPRLTHETAVLAPQVGIFLAEAAALRVGLVDPFDAEEVSCVAA